MNLEDRRREATRAAWRKSYETWAGRPEAERLAGEFAINTLLARLRTCQNEDELHDSYWQPGDWPSPVLLRQLPNDPGLEELLTLEEAAFWLRYLELREQGQ